MPVDSGNQGQGWPNRMRPPPVQGEFLPLAYWVVSFFVGLDKRHQLLEPISISRAWRGLIFEILGDLANCEVIFLFSGYRL